MWYDNTKGNIHNIHLLYCTLFLCVKHTVLDTKLPNTTTSAFVKLESLSNGLTLLFPPCIPPPTTHLLIHTTYFNVIHHEKYGSAIHPCIGPTNKHKLTDTTSSQIALCPKYKNRYRHACTCSVLLCCISAQNWYLARPLRSANA